MLAEWKRQGKLVVEPRRGPLWRLAADGSATALRTELLRIANALRAQGVDPVGLLSQGPGAAPAAPTTGSERLEERILAALDRLMPEPGAVVSVTALRSDPALAGIEKQAFDAAVLGLVRQGTLFPHGHNDPYSLPEERRRSLVAAGPNVYYVALGRR